MGDSYCVDVSAVHWKTNVGRELEQILKCEFKKFRDQGVELLKTRLLHMGRDWKTQSNDIKRVFGWSIEQIDVHMSDIIKLQNIWTDLNSAKRLYKSEEQREYVRQLRYAFHNNLSLDENPFWTGTAHTQYEDDD